MRPRSVRHPGVVRRPPIPHPRLLDLDWADARHQGSLGQVAVANDLTVAALILNVPVLIDPLGDFRLNGMRQQSLSAVAKNARQHVLGAYGWQGNNRVATLSHGGVLRGECGCEETKFKPKYAAFFNSTHPQLSVIALSRGTSAPNNSIHGTY